jgi:hypothetical protein
MRAVDVEIGPAAILYEDFVTEPELLVEKITMVFCVVATDDLDHGKRPALVCAESSHELADRDIPWAGD